MCITVSKTQEYQNRQIQSIFTIIQIFGLGLLVILAISFPGKLYFLIGTLLSMPWARLYDSFMEDSK